MPSRVLLLSATATSGDLAGLPHPAVGIPCGSVRDRSAEDGIGEGPEGIECVSELGGQEACELEPGAPWCPSWLADHGIAV